MTDYREKDYTKEIRFKGVETLNKFLLLLKEERNVVKRKEKGLEILRDNDKDFLEEYVEKMSTDEALKGEEFSVDPEKFFLVKEKNSSSLR